MFRKHLIIPKFTIFRKSFKRLSHSIAFSAMEMTRRHIITCRSTKPDVTSADANEPPSPSRQSSTEEKIHVVEAYQESFHEQKSSNGCRLTMIEPDYLPESSKIALQHKLLTTSQERMDQELAGLWKSEGQVIDNGASCTALHATRTPILGKVGVAVDKNPLSRTFDSHHSLHDMLCIIAPTIIDERNTKHLHDILLPYRHNPRHIVIDSHCPEVAPHIVITRPDDAEELLAPNTAFNNRINDQWMQYLFIPRTFPWTSWPFQLHDSLHPSYAPPHNTSYPCEPLQLQTKVPDSLLLFNASQNQQVLNPVHLGLNNATPVQLFGEAAVAASLEAAEFRARYDTPGFAESIERPYRWIDPAEAIFETMRIYPTGGLFIPSPNPFTAPHFVIDQALPQAIPDNNFTDIQDYNSGNCLVVPSTCHVHHHYTNERVHIPLIQYPLYEDGETDSLFDSPLPETPRELLMESSGEFGNLFHSEQRLYDDFHDDESPHCLQRGYFHPEPYTHFGEIPLDCRSVKFFLQDDNEEEAEEGQIVDEGYNTADDDEDGPPPFDEWYLDAIKTHNLPLTPSISNILQTTAT